MKSFLILLPLLLCLGCGGRPGGVAASVKGHKIFQVEIDSLFGSIKEAADRNSRVRDYLKEKLDNQVLHNQAVRMGFHRQTENKAILKNIEMIETANFYMRDVLKKNWGFGEADIDRRYRADRERYRKEKPQADTVPTPEQKKSLEAFEKDPFQPLDVVRGKVLRTLLLEKPENKAAVEELVKSMGVSVDSGRILQKEDEIINAHVSGIDSAVYEDLKMKHGVEVYDYIPKITDDELKAEWENTKSSFKRKPDLEAQHIEVDNEKTADQIVDDVNNKGKDFLALQKKHSKNRETLGRSIAVRSSDEVAGIAGDTRSIYPKILYVPVGKASTPIALTGSASRQKYHVFKVVNREEEALMSFEEAKPEVKKNLFTKKQVSMPLTAVLAKVDGKPLTAEQVFTLLYKMSPMVTNRYKTEEGRKTLVSTYYLKFLLFDRLAREQGVDRLPDLMARIETAKRDFLINDFKQNYLEFYYGLPVSQCMDYYKSHSDSFKSGDKAQPYDDVKYRVVQYVMVPDSKIEDYYRYNLEEYTGDNGQPKPLAEVRSAIFYELLGNEKKYRLADCYRTYRRDFGLKVYKPEYVFEESADPAKIFEEAKKLHEDRKYTEAKDKYIEILYRHRDFKESPDIIMALAQIYVEDRQYPKAIQQYRRFLRLFADSKDKYKAQFMIAFVYSENVQDTAKAIESYQSVIDNYPQCDLVESAKFMIEHLKTGKEFVVFDDSTNTADTLFQADSAGTN